MRQFILIAVLMPWAFAAYGPLLAAGPECMRFVPELGKAVPVPCEEEGAADLKKQLVESTEALTSAAADSGLRDSLCTWIGNVQVLRELKDKDQVQKLQKELAALEEKIGKRGHMVYAALFSKDTMNMVLETPVDIPVDTGHGTRLKQTPEGQAYIRARDALHLTCNCMREADPPKRMVCCDSCDKETLQEGGGHALR